MICGAVFFVACMLLKIKLIVCMIIRKLLFPPLGHLHLSHLACTGQPQLIPAITYGFQSTIESMVMVILEHKVKSKRTNILCGLLKKG